MNWLLERTLSRERKSRPARPRGAEPPRACAPKADFIESTVWLRKVQRVFDRLLGEFDDSAGSSALSAMIGFLIQHNLANLAVAMAMGNERLVRTLVTSLDSCARSLEVYRGRRLQAAAEARDLVGQARGTNDLPELSPLTSAQHGVFQRMLRSLESHEGVLPQPYYYAVDESGRPIGFS